MDSGFPEAFKRETKTSDAFTANIGSQIGKELLACNIHLSLTIFRDFEHFSIYYDTSLNSNLFVIIYFGYSHSIVFGDFVLDAFRYF